MSVLTLSEKEFQDIVTTIILEKDKYDRDLIIPAAERLEIIELLNKKVTEKDENISIALFFQRLMVANQVAFAYQYKDNKIQTEFSKDFGFEKGELLTDEKLHEQLRLLRYNLYINAGICFLNSKDLKRLDNFITTLMHRKLKDF